MPDGFVDLKDHLLAVEQERGLHARAVGRRQQLHGLGRGSLRLLEQREGPDVFKTRRRQMPPEGVGERPSLHLAVADGGGLDTAAGVDDGLLDRRTLGGSEGRSPPIEVEHGLGERQGLHGLHPPGSLHQERHLLFQGDREGVLLDVRLPHVPDRFDVSEPDGIAGQTGGRPGDLDGEPGGAVDVLLADPGGGGEPPVPVGQDSDPHTLRAGPVDPLHLLVLDRE
jgi:hypothetical protein